MSARRVAVLLGLAVIVIGFAIWLSSRRHLDRDLTAGELVLPGLEQQVNTVTTVNLQKGDGTRSTLTKSGASWSVTERGWPADVTKVRKLLLDLVALNIVEEKTRLPANYWALGVEDVTGPKATGTLVELLAPAKRWALILGKPSGAKAGFVRVPGTPQSLLAAPPLSVDADPKTWLTHELLDVGATRVRAVEEKPAQGPAFTASRDKAEQLDFAVSPLPKGRSLSAPSAADAIAGALSALTLDDVRKAESAAPAAAARAVFHTFDGLDIELAGRKDGTHALVSISARAASAPAQAEAQKISARTQGWEFEIPDYKYTALFTPLEDLLAKPPEPAKKAGKASPPDPALLGK